MNESLIAGSLITEHLTDVYKILLLEYDYCFQILNIFIKSQKSYNWSLIDGSLITGYKILLLEVLLL